MGSTKSDHKKELITLTVITLSGFHCTIDVYKGEGGKGNETSKFLKFFFFFIKMQ